VIESKGVTRNYLVTHKTLFIQIKRTHNVPPGSDDSDALTSHRRRANSASISNVDSCEGFRAVLSLTFDSDDKVSSRASTSFEPTVRMHTREYQNSASSRQQNHRCNEIYQRCQLGNFSTEFFTPMICKFLRDHYVHAVLDTLISTWRTRSKA